MNHLAYYIGLVIIILVINAIIFTTVYKNTEKIDKGFVLIYHKLTYRRKLIRILWGIPIVFLLFLTIYWLGIISSNEYVILGILFILVASIDLAYNYIKWRNNESE
ncbi:hypothetical protein SAMN05216244_2311 [Sediminibacillus halophilus]|uniref:SdpI/YhfL protein family protein n=1 Tax=Sediminibacillus halophilus TaxID=482461 RepID=A0A1G9S720_9BACI|nr:hypothetical protein SAMN05216244_2311 [Sediminibacillus halophilus]